MEIPYTGRAIINDNYDGMEIIIPAKKNWFVLVFLCFWLCGWVVGETFAIREVTGLGGHGAPDGFLTIWLCGWTVGGVFAFSTLWWNIAGKEIINIQQGVLTINKKGAIFKRLKSYDLNQAKNFRALEDPDINNGFGRSRQASLLNPACNGTIKFDYGMETVKFGDKLYQAEGDHILGRLRAKKLIS